MSLSGQRKRYREDEGGADEAGPVGRKHTALIVFVCVVGGLVAFMGLVIVVLLAGRAGRQAARTNAPERMTLDEVREKVEGKTPKETLAALGRPSDTHSQSTDDIESPDYSATWMYGRLIVDRATGNYATVVVRFRNGKAYEVRIV